MSEPSTILWPERYEPSNCPVHVRNELEIAAPPERVWALLVRAPLWHGFYENASNVKILDGSGPDLRKGTRFRWKTFGVTLTTQVHECVRNERIAWEARSFGINAYHAWLLRPSARGCHVLTEETQHGVLARLQNMFLPHRMRDQHQLWLEGLAAKAE